MAVLGAAGDQAAPAARLLAAVATICAAGGYSDGLPERADHEWAAERSRATLGEEAFAHAWATGQTMSDEAIDADIQAILAAAESAAPQPRPEDHAGGLTPRELVVLRLLAEGRTDREIAAAIFVSPRTVGKHVTNLLAKLERPLPRRRRDPRRPPRARLSGPHAPVCRNYVGPRPGRRPRNG